ncbi:hypothetical protein L3Y21_gp111 [Gordonia phage Rabbitrun]|uniref:Uncharacterized protein n=1 Tax=Gordonia phage Rabbitrun TaxID=2762280 RepID=A0A7G8LIT6_9CAUD|nr:hypothetical protein L3Y21_gp111 [Gordonia phage Rabbitrun]QNJ57158.1 hypothetical protein SEA_RABBITRUN_125 [Gordonia phage Rabbitrun]
MSDLYVALNAEGESKFVAHPEWSNGKPRIYAYETRGPARAIANKVGGSVVRIRLGQLSSAGVVEAEIV